MISADLRLKIENVERDLSVVMNGPNFVPIRNNSVFMGPWSEARDLALRWLSRVKATGSQISDSSIQPLLNFARSVVEIANGPQFTLGRSIPDAISSARVAFQTVLPVMCYELLEDSGITSLSKDTLEGWKDDAVGEVRSSATEEEKRMGNVVTDLIANIKLEAEQAVKDFEFAKTEASKISVEAAERQFKAAQAELSKKSIRWSTITVVLFIVLVLLLLWFLWHPPALIEAIVEAIRPGSKAVPLPVSTPLLLAASAYFTSIRLALVGLVGIGLALSLRMMRAYFHLIEHNEHKLRVTNSIEAFVAAVRTREQKDLVLGKLVESVTEFSDPGIISGQSEPSGLHSVVFEPLIKTFSKSD